MSVLDDAFSRMPVPFGGGSDVGALSDLDADGDVPSTRLLDANADGDFPSTDADGDVPSTRRDAHSFDETFWIWTPTATAIARDAHSFDEMLCDDIHQGCPCFQRQHGNMKVINDAVDALFFYVNYVQRRQR